MPSFDAVSELDSHELTNAVDQANRELTQRFDFKDSGAEFTLKEKEHTVSMKAPAEFQLKQMIDILTLLEAKTRGNLSAEERQLLDQILFELRLRYVEASKPQSRIITP